MNKIYTTVGSSELKVNPRKVFDMLDGGPVVILSKSTPKAVMVSIEEWNTMSQLFEECIESILIKDKLDG